jgi:hypothetical protein
MMLDLSFDPILVFHRDARLEYNPDCMTFAEVGDSFSVCQDARF